MAAALFLASLFLLCFGTIQANPPLLTPVQYEKLNENKIEVGSEFDNISTSIIDKKIALEYFDHMAEDNINAFGQNHNAWQNLSEKQIETQKKLALNQSNLSMINISKAKFLVSEIIFVGMGSIVREKDLPSGRNTKAEKAFITNKNGMHNTSHLIGLETKNSFNATWGTDITWHKIFYKDVKAHEMFTGVFEAEKTIKFHEKPMTEMVSVPCDGIDCGIVNDFVYPFISITIDSDPSGADIYINGENKGKTPNKINFGNPGRFDCELRHKNCEIYKTFILIPSNSHYRLLNLNCYKEE